MRFFKHKKEKQNIAEAENLHPSSEVISVGFSGGSKAIVLASTALVIAALLASAPIIGSKTESELQLAYADIASKANEKLQSSDYGEAIELFKKAIEINPDDEELYIGLADSYSGVNEEYMAREILKTGYSKTKSSGIKTKLDELNNGERQTKKVEELLKQGQDCLSDNDNEAALEAFLEAIDIDPKCAEAYIFASRIIGNNERAIELLTKGYNQTNDASVKIALDELLALKNESSEAERSETIPPISEEQSNTSSDSAVVSIKNLTEQNSQSYDDVEIFKSSAEWFELSSKENLIGAEKINASINDTLNRYIKLDLSVYGFESEDDILNLVKANNRKLETNISASVTYINDSIISYTVQIDVQSPNASDFSTVLELHTIDLKTGNELSLKDILNSDEVTVKKKVAEAFNLAGVKFTESEFEELKFYIENEKITLIAPLGKAYIPLNSEKSKTAVSSGIEKSEPTSETR